MLKITKEMFLCGLCFGLVSYVFFNKKSPSESWWSDSTLKDIIDAWNQNIKPAQHGQDFAKVVIGFNANVDLIVNGTLVLQALNVKSAHKELDHAELRNLEELEQTFSLSLMKGSGMERPFSNSEPFQQLVSEASNSVGAQWFIGGNAGLMAQKIGTTFSKVQLKLIAPIGPRLKKLLHKSVKYGDVCARNDDEVHLIMEYKVGERWGSQQAKIANRFITSYDMTNSRLELMSELFAVVHSDKPDLLILSGLHMLESQPSDFRTQRLNELKEHLKGTPKNLAIHLELASMSDMSFVKEICLQLLEHVTSLGLNEQELSFTAQALGRSGHLGKGSHPSHHIVTEMMLSLINQFGYDEINRPLSRLTRIHFHSLTFHMMSVITDQWSNLESAVAAGTHIAGQQACDCKQIKPDQVELRLPKKKLKLSPWLPAMQFNSSQPVSSWIEEGRVKFVFSPVLVCKIPLKTVGLGDAISATGLLYSSYKPAV